MTWMAKPEHPTVEEKNTIYILGLLQSKYTTLFRQAKENKTRHHYYNLIQAIDDIIDDLKEEA